MNKIGNTFMATLNFESGDEGNTSLAVLNFEIGNIKYTYYLIVTPKLKL